MKKSTFNLKSFRTKYTLVIPVLIFCILLLLVVGLIFSGILISVFGIDKQISFKVAAALVLFCLGWYSYIAFRTFPAGELIIQDGIIRSSALTGKPLTIYVRNIKRIYYFHARDYLGGLTLCIQQDCRPKVIGISQGRLVDGESILDVEEAIRNQIASIGQTERIESNFENWFSRRYLEFLNQKWVKLIFTVKYVIAAVLLVIALIKIAINLQN